MENCVKFKGYILGYHTIHIFSSCDWNVEVPDAAEILKRNGYPNIYEDWDRFHEKYYNPYDSIYFDKDFIIQKRPVKTFRDNRLMKVE